MNTVSKPHQGGTSALFIVFVIAFYVLVAVAFFVLVTRAVYHALCERHVRRFLNVRVPLTSTNKMASP